MIDLDATITHAVNHLAGLNAVPDVVMIWISSIGAALMVAAVALQWWRRQGRPHIRHVIVAAGLSFLSGLGINQLILVFIHRARPYDAGVTNLLIQPSVEFSFPSDHATATVAIAAAFWVHGSRRAGLAFTAAAFLVAFSRVYIGTHYVGDVLGGAMTGIVAAFIVHAVYREGTRADRLITSIL